MSAEAQACERLLWRRRPLVVGLSALMGANFAEPYIRRALAARDGLFSLGVTSGDPLPDSVVLWTRLAPDPLAGGGMPDRPVTVEWQVAADENLRRIVRSGTTVALPEWGHAVHVEVAGLQPGRWYWYRFKVGGEVSPTGRTRTAPAPGERPAQLRFAFASCQHYEHGYYSAYRDMARAELDFVVFLGDYIYERGADLSKSRRHDGPEITTLAQYRNRYALYKLDPALQAAHAAFPWIVTWDDHEVDNNYAGLVPEDGQTLAAFRERRTAAYRAYYEHMPLRRPPKGLELPLYRRLRFGDLASLHVLDTRQYRTDQPCGDNARPRCPEALSPEATMTGSAQEQWLLSGLATSPTRWNVLAQQTVMGQFDIDPGPGAVFSMDQWDGYSVQRARLLEFISKRQVANPVVITGDVHSNWVFDLKADFDRPESATVATEFAGTSISSDFPLPVVERLKAAMSANPHTKFFEGRYRGYSLVTLTPKLWRTDYRVVASITNPESPVSTLASFVVEAGKPGAVRA